MKIKANCIINNVIQVSGLQFLLTDLWTSVLLKNAIEAKCSLFGYQNHFLWLCLEDWTIIFFHWVSNRARIFGFTKMIFNICVFQGLSQTRFVQVSINVINPLHCFLSPWDCCGISCTCISHQVVALKPCGSGVYRIISLWSHFLFIFKCRYYNLTIKLVNGILLSPVKSL